MLFKNVAIEGLAYQLPTERIASSHIEMQITATMERLHIPLGILEGFTGIRERRLWAPGVMPSDVATIAARKVIDQVGIDPKKIGCLVNTSVSRDYLEPSVASLVHGNLNLSPHCLNYDIGNACLGFIDGICHVGLMIEAGVIKYGLVVAGESAREPLMGTIARLQSPQASMQMFRDNFATLTLGSGAVAMLLCHRELSRAGHRVNGSVSLAATEYNRLCVGQADHMVTDASALMAAGSKLAAATSQLASRIFDHWNDDDIAVYAPHQVSARNTMVMARALGITYDKLYLNFPILGNIGAAAVPITLAMSVEDRRLCPGQQAGLLAIGSGINCTMMSVAW